MYNVTSPPPPGGYTRSETYISQMFILLKIYSLKEAEFFSKFEKFKISVSFKEDVLDILN